MNPARLRYAYADLGAGSRNLALSCDLAGSLDAEILYCVGASNVAEVVAQNPGRFALFTNFSLKPPVAAQKQTVWGHIQALSGDPLATAIRAGPPPSALDNFPWYRGVRRFLYDLLRRHPDLHIHVITRAAPDVVSDADVLSLSPDGRITVKRVQDFGEPTDYAQFINYIHQQLEATYGQAVRRLPRNASKTVIEWRRAKGSSESAQQFAAIFPSLCSTLVGLRSMEPTSILIVDENPMRLQLLHEALSVAFPNGRLASPTSNVLEGGIATNGNPDVIVVNARSDWNEEDWKRLNALSSLAGRTQLVTVGDVTAKAGAVKVGATHVSMEGDLTVSAVSLVKAVQQASEGRFYPLKHFARLTSEVPAAILFHSPYDDWRVTGNPRMLRLLGAEAAFAVRVEALPEPVRSGLNKCDMCASQIDWVTGRSDTGRLFVCKPGWIGPRCVFESPMSPEHGRQIATALQNSIYPAIMEHVQAARSRLESCTPPAALNIDAPDWQQFLVGMRSLGIFLFQVISADLRLLQALCVTDWPSAPKSERRDEIECNAENIKVRAAPLIAISEFWDSRPELRRSFAEKMPIFLSGPIRQMETIESLVKSLSAADSDPNQ